MVLKRVKTQRVFRNPGGFFRNNRAQGAEINIKIFFISTLPWKHIYETWRSEIRSHLLPILFIFRALSPPPLSRFYSPGRLHTIFIPELKSWFRTGLCIYLSGALRAMHRSVQRNKSRGGEGLKKYFQRGLSPYSPDPWTPLAMPSP